ncbi:MAG: hypothetical protein U0031_12555 [Thermomicrobiales bacterium]
MIGRYAVLAGRIRQDLSELERVAARAEQAMRAYQERDEDRDLLVDAAALNVHDFYTGLERIFTRVATTLDQTLPAGPEWHRELLKQMAVEIPGLRPAVLTPELVADVDEFLRFRHVVRHLYAFELDPERIDRLVHRLGPTSRALLAALASFATALEMMAEAG